MMGVYRMRKYFIGLVVFCFCILGAGLASAGDSKINVEIKPGYHFIGHDDEMTKVGEYESLSSGAEGEIKVNANIGLFRGDVHAFYYDEDEKEWSAFLDFGRVLRVDYMYNSFLHRLQHDYLYKDEPHFPKAIPPNNVDELVAFNPFWVYNGTDVSLEGAQMVAADDLDSGRDYQIFRSKQEIHAKFQVPFFPYIIPEVRAYEENKRGWRQATFMSGKCTPCHIIGIGRRINEHTKNITAGFTVKYGIITASYFHTWRHFDNEAGTPQWRFDVVATPNPTLTDIFSHRLMYDGETSGYAEIPDVRKSTDKVKLRIALPYHTTIYGSFVDTEVENDYTNKDYGITAYAGRITTTLLNNALTLSLKARYYTIDNDDVYVNVAGLSNDASFSASDPSPDYSRPISDFNYERKSNMDRDVTEIGLNVRYRLARRYTLRVGYTYTRIDRDNDKWKDYDSNIPDEEFLEDEDTTIHHIKLSMLGRPLKTLNFRLTYEYEHRDDPFENHNGICLENRYLPRPGGVGYYNIFRNDYRTKDATNVPDDTHNVKLVATWSPNMKYSATLNLQYKYQENDDSDWEGETYLAGLSFWLSPIDKLFVTLGANYEYNTYETRFDLNLFGG